MKISNAILSLAAATLLIPAACPAQDQPPPPDGQQHRGGPFKGRESFPIPFEIMKLAAEYRANPSDDLKAQIKTKVGEALDKFVKEERARLDKLQANKDKEIDAKIEKLLTAKPEDKGKGKRKPPQE